jgi:hypothetical protein
MKIISQEMKIISQEICPSCLVLNLPCVDD